MNLHPVIAYLYGLQLTGIKLGLDTIAALCAQAGDPQRKFPSVHVAGTNGKGSVSSVLASIMQCAGYRTGLYTSPHLVDFTERMRIDGVPIPMDTLIAYINDMRPMIDRLNATFFEATTAVAFRWFADSGVDIAIIETGLGGRLDATNVLAPEVSIITSIDYDHMEFLGTTLADIAFEKAGIIKPGVPVCFSATAREAHEVITRTATERGAARYEFDASDVRSTRMRDLDAMELEFDPRIFPGPITSALIGRHQASNLGLALLAARILADGRFDAVDDDVIRRGVASVRATTKLRARMELLQRRPEIVLDVCHNPGGVDALVRTWTTLRRPDHTHLVFGLLNTKDFDTIIRHLRRHRWKSVTLVQADVHDAVPSAVLKEAADARGLRAESAGGVYPAMCRVMDNADESDSIVLFGSHYVVGEFLHRAGGLNFFA